MKQVELRFLQMILSHVSGDKVTLALIHWDGTNLRIAFSFGPLSLCDPAQHDIVSRTVMAKLHRAAGQAGKLMGQTGLTLKNVVPVREGTGASLYWSPIQVSLTSDPRAHFDQIRRGLRLEKEYFAGEYPARSGTDR